MAKSRGTDHADIEEELPMRTQSVTHGTDAASTIEIMSHTPLQRTKQQGPDEATATGSIYSYRSERDISGFIREYFGRGFNNLNDLYMLPTDESEWNRLDKQHSSLLIAFGGLYPCPELVEPLLLGDAAEEKHILDVGCGTGSWAIEMARQFPHTVVKAIDLSPIPIDASHFPPNLEFEINDVNLGMSRFYDQYDLVHMRFVRAGLADNRKTITELERCLKPGGMLIVIEADSEFADADFKKAKMARVEGDEDVNGVSEKGSWFNRMHWEAVETHGIAAADRDLTSRFIDHGFWDHPLLDPRTVVTGSAYLPIGPWAKSHDPLQTQLLQYVGTIMRQNCSNLHRAFHPILLKHGMSQEVLNNWSKHTQEELDALRVPMSLRIPFCLGRRRAAEGLSAPSVPITSTIQTRSSVSTLGKNPHFRPPFFEVFHSRDEAVAARIQRRESLGVFPTATVRKAYSAIQHQ